MADSPVQDEPHYLRILVVRPDRLGDVILSTPVFEVIKHYYTRAHLTALVKENVTPILKGLAVCRSPHDFRSRGST